MNQNSANLIGSLEPNIDLDTRIRKSLHSIRNGGAFRQLLKKPTRYIESSRGYVQGDPVQYIDWKVFGKTEKLYVREMRDESSSFVGVYVDVGRTMCWPNKEELDHAGSIYPTKIEVAVRVALNLAYNHSSNGDFVDLVFDDGSESKMIRLKSSSEVLALFSTLIGEGFTVAALSKYAVNTESVFTRTYKISYLLSDFIADRFDGLKLEEAINRHAIQILSRLEADIDWVNKADRFVDGTSSKSEYDGNAIKTSYDKEFFSWQDKLKSRFKAVGATHFLITDETTVDSYASKLSEAKYYGI